MKINMMWSYVMGCSCINCAVYLRPLTLFTFKISSKPCSGYKMKEMTGSGIFAPKAENDASESDGANLTPKPAIRMYQVPINMWLIFRLLLKHIS